jgi:hypothetical protein
VTKSDTPSGPGKECRKCGHLQPWSEFYRERSAADGYRPECKACAREYRRQYYRRNREAAIARVQAWREANPDLYVRYQRAYRKKRPHAEREGHLRRKFGLTLADYARLLELQGGGCAICGDAPEEGKNLHVDHDHATGGVRGLLCMRCNNGIGLLREDADVLTNAAAYVRTPDELDVLVRERAYALT